MQRLDKEIKDKNVIINILKEAKIGRLGTCTNGEPYIVPLSFVYNDNKISFHCAKQGKKLSNIIKNPRVCFEVDMGELMQAEKPCDFSFKYQSVIAQGTAKISTELNKKFEILMLLTEKYASYKKSQMTKEIVSKYKNMAVVEIEIDEISGKKSPV